MAYFKIFDAFLIYDGVCLSDDLGIVVEGDAALIWNLKEV